MLRPDAKDEARTRLRRGERRKVLEKGPSLISLKETCIRYVARNALLFETFPIPEELKEKIIREMIDKEIFTKVLLLSKPPTLDLTCFRIDRLIYYCSLIEI